MNQDRNDNFNARPILYEQWYSQHTQGTLAILEEQYDQAASHFAAAALFLYGDESPAAKLSRADSYVGQAIAVIQLQRFQLALDLLQTALELRQGLLPELHSLNAEAWHHIANALFRLKLYKEAGSFYERAVNCLMALYPDGDPYLQQVVANWLICAAAAKTMEEIENDSSDQNRA